MEEFKDGYGKECEEVKCEKCGHDEFKLFQGEYELFAKCVKCGHAEMKAG